MYAKTSRFTENAHGKKMLPQEDFEDSVDLPPQYDSEVTLENE